MQITAAMTGVIKGYETGAKMVHGRPVLLPHGQPALTAYTDAVGIWTIGWGHTNKNIGPKSVVTLSIAEQMFATDIAFFEHGVSAAVAGGAPTSQGQFDAMVAFSYNCGLGAFDNSTLLKYHRAGNYVAAANEFGRWTNHGLHGLVLRRAEEKSFYLRH